MERRGGHSTAEVTTEQVRQTLARSEVLGAEEEKVVRMRRGIALGDLHAPLPRAAGTNVALADELLLLEMQLLRGHQARTQAKAKPQLSVVSPEQQQTKSKIVRALRRRR